VGEVEVARLWRHAGLLVLAYLATSCSPGESARPRVIEAEQIVLRDTQGNVRLRLGNQGEPSIVFLRRTGRIAMEFAMSSQDEPCLTLHDGHGKMRLRMSLLAGTGQPGIELFGRNQALGVDLTMAPGDKPRLNLRDKKGWTKCALVVDDSTSGFYLKSKESGIIVSISEMLGLPSMTLSDKQGRVRLRVMVASADGQVFVQTYNEAGEAIQNWDLTGK
jgi:hypothetical protein